MPHTASSTVVSVVKPSGKPQPQDLGVFDFPGGDGARADCPGRSFSPQRCLVKHERTLQPSKKRGRRMQQPQWPRRRERGERQSVAQSALREQRTRSREMSIFFQTLKHRACECASVILYCPHSVTAYLRHLLTCYCDRYQYHPGMGGFPGRELTTFQT